MPVKLFVGGLAFTTTTEGLRQAFVRFGNVASAVVMTDRQTGRSRGFGFVEMTTAEEAERAIGGLNGSSLDGRMIRVDKATPRGTAPPGGPRRSMGPPAPRGPGFGAGFGQGQGQSQGQGPGRPDARSPGRAPGRPDRRRGEESEGRRPAPKRKGPSRRAEDKGRRSEEGYRW
jgi:RNA recognition motif-containing protein